MDFEGADAPVTEEDLKRVEAALGMGLPGSLRRLYLAFNGGEPNPYVYQDEHLDTVVSEFLPISSAAGRRTAVDVYHHLVRGKHLVADRFFPFAVDGGGDYFFVDVESGEVAFFRSDSARGRHLLPLKVDIDAFWERLKPEEE